MLHRSCGFLIISLCFWRFTQAEIFDECGQKNNVYVATSQSCSKYIFCDGEESFMGECEAETPYFSEVDQTCDKESSVCKGSEQTGAGPNSTVASSESPSTTSVTQSTASISITLTNSTLSTTVTSAPVTTAPVTPAPVSSTPASGTPGTITPVTTAPVTTAAVTAIPVTTIPVSSISVSSTPVSSTSVSTTTPVIISSSDTPATSSSNVPTSTAATNVASHCPATDDPSAIVFLSHTTSCSNYFMCYHGEPMAMHCSNMLHFDPKSQKCDYPENVKCQLDSALPREKCQVHTIDSYPYPANCNYYYICRFGYLMVMQCPLNMDWDNEKKVCTLSGRAKCYHHHSEVEIAI